MELHLCHRPQETLQCSMLIQQSAWRKQIILLNHTLDTSSCWTDDIKEMTDLSLSQTQPTDCFRIEIDGNPSSLGQKKSVMIHIITVMTGHPTYGPVTLGQINRTYKKQILLEIHSYEALIFCQILPPEYLYTVRAAPAKCDKSYINRFYPRSCWAQEGHI